jgi:hypothetical protein
MARDGSTTASVRPNIWVPGLSPIAGLVNHESRELPICDLQIFQVSASGTVFLAPSHMSEAFSTSTLSGLQFGLVNVTRSSGLAKV